jgi:guanylate kinase
MWSESGYAKRDPASGEPAPGARRGQLFVISAPSGTGKTTVAERLVQVVPELSLSRSYTSRPARAGEAHGIDYNFITRARFEQMIAEDAFLEWADVFGNLYGTCAADAEADLATGRDLVLVIDVQGARQVRNRQPGTVGVFVLPPSFAILERRLRGRSADSEEAMQRRLQTARDEVVAFVEYDYVVVNDALEACVDRVRAIVLAERAKLAAAREMAQRIVRTFTSTSD